MTTSAAIRHRVEGSIGHPADTNAVQWYVLHTRPRQEKAVARTLRAAGIAHYLPLVRRTTYHGNRKRSVELPLFASYLFLHGSRESTYVVADTGRLVHVLPVVDQTRFSAELGQIQTALGGGAVLEPCAFLEVGHRVRVIAGPWKGIEGLIESRTRCDRLILQVQALGRATSLEIDAGLLEPID